MSAVHLRMYNLDFADDVTSSGCTGPSKQISVAPVVAEDSEEYALREDESAKALCRVMTSLPLKW